MPVLLEESLEGLDIRPDGIYVDVTFGGGGHSRAIVERLRGGRLYGFDQDLDAVKNVEGLDSERFTFVRGNFRFLRNFLRYEGVERVDGILADLGVSSHHFDDASRGFSFRFEDVALDMRMNQLGGLTAADVLNGYDEGRLADVFYLYGELRQSRRLAAQVVKARQSGPLRTTGDFLRVLGDADKKTLARAFQALRIEVNGEMTALRALLDQSREVLKEGGRLVVITYHSLEDRMVKNMMRTGNVEGREAKDFFGRVEAPFRMVGRGVTVPSAEEVERNPRSRSAKLRVAERTGQER